MEHTRKNMIDWQVFFCSQLNTYVGLEIALKLYSREWIERGRVRNLFLLPSLVPERGQNALI